MFKLTTGNLSYDIETTFFIPPHLMILKKVPSFSNSKLKYIIKNIA